MYLLSSDQVIFITVALFMYLLSSGRVIFATSVINLLYPKMRSTEDANGIPIWVMGSLLLLHIFNNISYDRTDIDIWVDIIRSYWMKNWVMWFYIEVCKALDNMSKDYVFISLGGYTQKMYEQ